MNKEESLAFLQECMERVEAMTVEEVDVLQKSYDFFCDGFGETAEFEFISPLQALNYDAQPRIDNFRFSKEECEMDNGSYWKISVEGFSGVNESDDEELSFAA